MDTRIRFDEIPSVLEKNFVVTSAVRQLLKIVRENCQKFGKVTDEDLLALSAFFGEELEKALELVERKKVTYFHTNTDLGIYQVEGSSYRTYTIFPSVNYCSCASFKYQVSTGSQITCKHVLATILADAINSKNSIEVTNEHLKDLLLGSVSLEYYFAGCSMNSREAYPNRNACVGQFLPSNPLQIQQMFHSSSLPGVSPAFGMPPSNWVHVPPQTMPWGTPPETQPAVVRFTAGDFSPHLVPVKRKCESAMDVTPSKMLVTEEKMAAHMRGLHISDVEAAENVTSMSCKEEAMEADQHPKLVISDEIKNLKTESIIPESILKKLEKPELALVLWQPPATDLDSKLKELKRLSLTKGRERESESKEEGDVDMAIETEAENSMDSVFRPIDPVPMPPMQNQFFQPVPQCHGFAMFPQGTGNNFQT